MRVRRVRVWMADAVVDSLVVGALVGLGEALHVAVGGSAAGGLGVGALAVALAAIALAMVGLILVGPVGALALAAIAKVPVLGELRSSLRQPGEARVSALARVAIFGGAAAAFAAALFAAVVWAHGEFKAAGPIALLVAALATGLGVALLLVVSVLGAYVVPWLSRRRTLSRLSQGRLGAGVGLAVGLATTWVSIVVARTTSPEADLTAPTTYAGLVVALVAVRAVGVGGRLAGRRRQATLAVAASLVVAGLLGVGAWPHARGALLADATVSRGVLRALWHATDRDGDGASALFGGADCNDGDPSIGPTARELLGNGVDDNCRGGEPSPDELGPRVAAQASPVADRPRRNVLLISIDTLRADFVGAYGQARASSPQIDALAARGTMFRWAVSPSPTTRRAIPALMTGRYATTLRWQPRKDAVRVELGANPMLGELFTNGGFDTQAILCCTTLFDKPHGVVAGIATVDAKAEPAFRKDKHNAAELARRAGEWIGGRKNQTRPFFLWMHFLEPHAPYIVPPGAPVFGKRPTDKYASEIAYVDAQLGKIFASLRRAGRADDTVIAIVSDHGEEFGEHGGQFHGRTVFNESMLVPLVVFDPGGPAQIVDTPVAVVDVAPTLLGLAGLAAPAGMNGRSLAATVALGHPAPTDRVALGELLPDFRIRGDLVTGFVPGWHLVWDRAADTLQLFSLERDPLDQDPIEGGAIFDEVRARFFAAIDRELSYFPGGEDPPPAPKPPRPDARPAVDARPAADAATPIDAPAR